MEFAYFPYVMLCYVMLCYVMWNLFTVGSLQFCNESTIASLDANQNRPTLSNVSDYKARFRIDSNLLYIFKMF